MRGILKNKDEGEETVVFDRQTVIANTRRNAHLRPDTTTPDKTTSNEGPDDAGENGGSPLRWDERNLLINEREKTATMKIDEPKTPYEGGFDPNNDYYRDDNEVETEADGDGDGNDNGDYDDDDVFDLGEAADDEDFTPDAIEKVVVENENNDDNNDHDDQEEELESAAQHAARFEEMRKKHYLREAAVRPVDDDEDDDDE